MKFNIEVEMTPDEFKELTGFKNYGEIVEDVTKQVSANNPWLKLTQDMTDQMVDQVRKTLKQ